MLKKSIVFRLPLVLFFCIISNSCLASFICADLFSSEDFYVYSSTQGSAIRTKLETHLTRDNYERIFSHNYYRHDLKLFGAKAIVVMLPGFSPDVYFFATGVGSESWNTHHAEALKTILTSKYKIDLGQNNFLLNDYMRYAQGYEFTAVKTENGLQITRLDIESQITISRRMNNQVSLDFEKEALLLLIQRIESVLIQFKPPKIK